MMVVAHNILAQNAAYIDKSTNDKLIKSTKKLASGLKINSAADDAAHLKISEKMRQQIRGLDRGANNINEGIGYCQTADGALEEVEGMLKRMNELSVAAANGTYSDSDRQAVDDEIQQLKAEINRICVSTKYNEDYVFSCEDVEEQAAQKEKYRLSFYGIAKDIYIYNDSYDPANHTATYGGIAYNGKRYAWSTISPNMYDPATGEFRDGRYTLTADDGTSFTFISKAGTTPPTLEREYNTQVNGTGITIGGETIRWEDVRTDAGESLDPEDIRDETYHFNYRGVDVSFKPDADDEFSDVIHRLNGTVWYSNNQIPTEQTALFSDFSGSKMYFQTDQQVKDVLDGTPVDFGLELKAGDGTNGSFDGVWIEQNGVPLAGSEKSWADLGITDWDDMSEAIWENMIYDYSFEDSGIKTIQFRFHVINEISKDSAIQALDGVSLNPYNSVYLDNGVETEFNNSADKHLIGMEETYDNVNMSLATEYALGRDYAQKTWNSSYAQLTLTGDTFGVSYTGSRNGVPATETFESASNAQTALVGRIKSQIMASYNQQLAVVKARYLAGAVNPEDMSLAQVIGADKVTGNGNNTYLQEVFTLNFNDLNLKSTQTMTGSEDFAGAHIDFSGLGSSYQLMDLIGTGFNATCATCNNHYSVQFATNQSVQGAVSWQTVQIDGKNYRYSRVDNGYDHTILIDLDSMKQNSKTNGVDFSNTLVDLLGASGYAFHYNQYATNVTDAKLMLFDNRPEYAQGGTSSAQAATFAPFAFDFNSLADFDISLGSTNGSGNFTLRYQYDFSNLFKKFEGVATRNDTSGGYVKDPAAKGGYVKFDPVVHTGVTERYDITDVKLNTQGMDFDAYIEKYIKDTVIKSAVDATKVRLKSDFAGLRVLGNANANDAMVTSQGTPYQILPKKKGAAAEPTETVKIQCSANTKDNLYVARQKLSLQRLGIKKCNTLTESAANRAIRMSSAALEKVNTIRGNFGAYQNRLEHSYDANQNTLENTQSAESQMRDTDMAKEIMQNSALRLIQQSGQAMLAQANQQPNMVINLLK